jgi:hypothetical protein
MEHKLPSVSGGPILSKPKSVVVKLRLGFFDVFVEGSHGERAAFRLPLHQAGSDQGCKGLLVANFTTASVGIIDTTARVSPKNCHVLSIDILAMGYLPNPKLQVPIDLAADLVFGSIALSNVSTILTLPAADLPPPPSPTPPSSPVVQALAQESIPVTQSVWQAAPAP